MTRPTDPLFDQRIADWLEDDPRHAPGQVLETVLAALPSIPRRRVSRLPWRFSTMNMLTRLAAAAVIGVLAVGGTLYLVQRGQPAVGGPSPTPAASSSPSQPAVGGPSPTPAVSSSPSQPASPSTGPPSSVFQPGAPAWTATGVMIEDRYEDTATLLPDGKVLVAGGVHATKDPQGVLASAELYDPKSGSWTATGKMPTPRQSHTATLLPDGKVLVAGGSGSNSASLKPPLASAELYDPGSGSWTATGNMVTPRSDFTATLLPDGKVLVAGGLHSGVQAAAAELAAAELYDPGSGSWTATASLVTPRTGHAATLLPDGKVLVAGGYGGNGALASAERYDPGSGSWTAAGSMVTPRQSHTATLLPDGKVLVAGGFGAEAPVVTAELYDPGSATR